MKLLLPFLLCFPLIACSDDAATEKADQKDRLKAYVESPEGKRNIEKETAKAQLKTRQGRMETAKTRAFAEIEGTWISSREPGAIPIQASIDRDGQGYFEELTPNGATKNSSLSTIEIDNLGLKGSMRNPRGELTKYANWRVRYISKQAVELQGANDSVRMTRREF